MEDLFKGEGERWGEGNGWLFDVESLRQITFSQTEFYRSRGIFYTEGEKKIYVYKARRVGWEI